MSHRLRFRAGSSSGLLAVALASDMSKLRANSTASCSIKRLDHTDISFDVTKTLTAVFCDCCFAWHVSVPLLKSCGGKLMLAWTCVPYSPAAPLGKT